MRTYLHLVPVFGVVLSLWTLYGKSTTGVEALSREARDGKTRDGKTRDGKTRVSGPKGGKAGETAPDTEQQNIEQPREREIARIKAVSKLSVVLGLSAASAIALLGGAASSQASQAATLRFMLASSFVGSGYFLLSIGLIFRVATNRSIRLPGISSFSRRLP